MLPVERLPGFDAWGGRLETLRTHPGPVWIWGDPGSGVSSFLQWLGAQRNGPVLDDADFYQDCRNLLTPDGIMTVNLFGRSSSFDQNVKHIATAFGDEALWAFKPTREGNTVVLAQRTASRPSRALWEQRADIIRERWGLPANKWLNALRPLVRR